MSGEGRWLLCSWCGETTEAGRDTCWLCHASLENADEATPDLLEDPPRSVKSETATIGLAVAIATVCLGTFLSAPGSGVFMALIMVIPLLRTTLIVSRRKKRGRSSSSGTTMLLFLSSMAVTWIILTVVGVATFGTFCYTCIGVSELTDDDDVAVIAAGLAALAIVGVLCWLFSKWVRARWRRDIGIRRR